MEKGDKPKVSTFSTTKSGLKKKTSASLMKDKKPAKEKKPAKSTFKKTGGKKEGVVGETSFPAKQKQKQKQENIQIVKVNVNTSKEEKPIAKPVRKEITKQTTYITLDKPYALQPEEEELLSITKFIPNPPRSAPLMKSSAKVTTLVSNPKNEIPQANIQEQPFIPIKKKVIAKQQKEILIPEPEPEILKVIPQKKPSAPLKKKKEPKYDVPIEIFEPKKRTLGKTIEEEQPLVDVTSQSRVKKVKEGSVASTNSSSIDKSIQNSSINNNEKVQELVLAEFTVSEKQTESIEAAVVKDLEEEVYDYISNTDDANISNPNLGEKINIQNEPELEEEFGLTSAQLSSYNVEYTMTPKGSVQGLVEEIERKSSRGRPVKYTSEEERIKAIKEQKKASALRKKEEAKSIKQIETQIEYEKFIQGDYPALSLEEILLKDIVIPEKQFAEGYFASMSAEVLGQNLGQDIIVSSKENPLTTLMKPDISSDFASTLIDKLSDNNNFGTIQSAQEPQFKFE